MLEKDQIIVLHTLKYKESGLIIHAYSRNSGRQSFLLNRIGKDRARSIIPSLHQLSLLDIDAYVSKSSSFKYIRELTPSVKLNSLRSDIQKRNIALFISELIYKTVKESSPDQNFYNWIKDSAICLENMSDNFSNFHLYFLLSLCSNLGFLPKNNYCSQTPLFEIDSAGFVREKGLGSTCFSPQDSELLSRLLKSEFSSFMKEKISGERRFSFIESIIDYLEHHMECGLNIKSHLVLHEILHDL